MRVRTHTRTHTHMPKPQWIQTCMALICGIDISWGRDSVRRGKFSVWLLALFHKSSKDHVLLLMHCFRVLCMFHCMLVCARLGVCQARGDLARRLLLRLNISAAPHFYNLAALEGTLVCLMHLTARWVVVNTGTLVCLMHLTARWVGAVGDNLSSLHSEWLLTLAPWSAWCISPLGESGLLGIVCLHRTVSGC